MSDIRYKVLGRTTDGEDLIIQISPSFFEMIRNGGNPPYQKTGYNGSTPRTSTTPGQSATEGTRSYTPRTGQAPRTTGFGSRTSGAGRDGSRDRQGGGPRKPKEYIRRGRGSEIKL